MEVTTRNRSELKSYFVKNSIPTESNFAELIEGMINQNDDGLVKQTNNALSLEAVGDDASQKHALNLYYNFSNDSPDWRLSLNPRSDVANANTAQRGLSLSDGEGQSRLFIDRTTGNIGIGTVSPGSRLHVEGSGPQLAEFRQSATSSADAAIKIRGSRNASPSADIAYIDLANFDSDEGDGGTDYVLARISGGMTDNAGQTGYLRFYTNSGASLTEQMRLDKSGHLGIGTIDPQATLDVRGPIRGDYRQNSTSYFGLAAIGYIGYSGWAGLAHASSGGYAILQNSEGTTTLNASAGQSIGFRINNVPKLELKSDGKFQIGPGGTPLQQIIVGSISSAGTTYAGSGFTSLRSRTGVYQISFHRPFEAGPIVIATAGEDDDNVVSVAAASTYVNVYIYDIAPTGGFQLEDGNFHFIAIGV